MNKDDSKLGLGVGKQVKNNGVAQLLQKADSRSHEVFTEPTSKMVTFFNSFL